MAGVDILKDAAFLCGNAGDCSDIEDYSACECGHQHGYTSEDGWRPCRVCGCDDLRPTCPCGDPDCDGS